MTLSWSTFEVMLKVLSPGLRTKSFRKACPTFVPSTERSSVTLPYLVGVSERDGWLDGWLREGGEVPL